MCVLLQREKSSEVGAGGGGSSSGSVSGSLVGSGGSSGGVGVVTSVGGATSASGSAMAPSLSSGLTSGGHGGHLGEEPSDLEELEQFARTFKQRRIKLGFTQVRHGARVCVGRCVCVCRCVSVTLCVCFSIRETWALPWGSCTVTTSARRPSPVSRP